MRGYLGLFDGAEGNRVLLAVDSVQRLRRIIIITYWMCLLPPRISGWPSHGSHLARWWYPLTLGMRGWWADLVGKSYLVKWLQSDTGSTHNCRFEGCVVRIWFRYLKRIIAALHRPSRSALNRWEIAGRVSLQLFLDLRAKSEVHLWRVKAVTLFSHTPSRTTYSCRRLQHYFLVRLIPLFLELWEVCHFLGVIDVLLFQVSAIFNARTTL